MTEQTSSQPEIDFSDLPDSIKNQILRIKNSVSVVIGLLEVRNQQEIYYRGQRVRNAPPPTDRETHPEPSLPQPVVPFVPRTTPPFLGETTNREVETIFLSQLPPEAQGYVKNLFGVTTLSINVRGQRLEIGKKSIVYGGKKVIQEPQTQEIGFEQLPSWAQVKIITAKTNHEVDVVMQDGNRLVIDASQGLVQASFDKHTVTGIP